MVEGGGGGGGGGVLVWVGFGDGAGSPEPKSHELCQRYPGSRDPAKYMNSDSVRSKAP